MYVCSYYIIIIYVRIYIYIYILYIYTRIYIYIHIYVTGFWKTIPNRTFGISRNTNFDIHGTVFLWSLIVAMPDLLQ